MSRFIHRDFTGICESPLSGEHLNSKIYGHNTALLLDKGDLNVLYRPTPREKKNQ